MSVSSFDVVRRRAFDLPSNFHPSSSPLFLPENSLFSLTPRLSLPLTIHFPSLSLFSLLFPGCFQGPNPEKKRQREHENLDQGSSSSPPLLFQGRSEAARSSLFSINNWRKRKEGGGERGGKRGLIPKALARSVYTVLYPSPSSLPFRQTVRAKGRFSTHFCASSLVRSSPLFPLLPSPSYASFSRSWP